MEFANDQLVKAAVDSGRYTYLSTGVSSLEEIQIKAKKYKDINFVHTTLSEKVADANISAIDTIKKTINRIYLTRVSQVERLTDWIEEILEPEDENHSDS